MPSCKFYLKNYLISPKVFRKDEVSILAKFTVSRKERFEIRPDEKVLPRGWDFKRQESKYDHELNDRLTAFKKNLIKLYKDNPDISFAQFKEMAKAKFERVSCEKKTLFLALRQYIELSNSEKDSKTVAKFITLEKHLIKFDSIHPIDLETLDYNFCDKFKAYLYSVPNQFYLKHHLVNKGDFWEIEQGEGEPVGIFDEQVYAYLRQLKTFLKWAEKREYKIHPSYKSWQVIKRVHDPVTLTFEELHKLESCVYNSKALDIARDYLVMECRTGQRISDIKRFHIKDFSSTEYTFTPRKGNRLSTKTVTVYFCGYCANALLILQKYGGKMPTISEQKLNQNIKRACKEAGIDSEFVQYRWAGNKRVRFIGPKHEFISSHVGRKTFITLMFQEGISMADIMELAGIDDPKTLRHYKGKFDKQRLSEKLENLEKIPSTLMRKAN